MALAMVVWTQAPRLRGLYARAAAALLPGRGRLRDTVPTTEMVLRDAGADRDRLAAYARVCGFPVADTLPPTYPHVLAFPLALSLMVEPDFPFPAIRVVHLRNRIRLHRLIGAGERFDLRVRVENLVPHRRGRSVDVVAVATVDDEPVWQDVSTYLHKEPSAAPPAGVSSADESPVGTAAADTRRPALPALPARPEPTAIWRVGAGTGAAYAAVSGDRNPIHVSRLAARAAGFRRRIAHGMWSKARCLAQLGPRLPEAYEVEVTFAAPVLLPSTVHFSAAPADPAAPAAGGWRLALHSAASGRPHLTGEVR
jgi:acyl dehydratase